MTEQRTETGPVTAAGRTPKPDGWHTYHICAGLLRELTLLGHAGTVSEAMCPNCGEWYRGTVTPAAAIEELRHD